MKKITALRHRVHQHLAEVEKNEKEIISLIEDVIHEVVLEEPSLLNCFILRVRKNKTEGKEETLIGIVAKKYANFLISKENKINGRGHFDLEKEFDRLGVTKELFAKEVFKMLARCNDFFTKSGIGIVFRVDKEEGMSQEIDFSVSCVTIYYDFFNLLFEKKEASRKQLNGKVVIEEKEQTGA